MKRLIKFTDKYDTCQMEDTNLWGIKKLKVVKDVTNDLFIKTINHSLNKFK